ncbi:MAG: LEA type 2 family protein [Candidatus Cyclobacteriaceae bacterium M2_1C_046]
MKHLIIFFTFIVILSSCKTPEEEPEFKYVHNVQVKKITGQEVLLNADAVFYNPNNMRMKLRGVDVDVFVEEKKVGEINQDIKTDIPALDDFTVPFDATFNIKEVGGLNTLMSVLGGKKLLVRYKGNIRVTVNNFPFRVPVDYQDEVSFR